MCVPLALPFRNVRTAAQRQGIFPAMFEIKIGNPKHLSAWAWLGRSGAALRVPECGSLPGADTSPAGVLRQLTDGRCALGFLTHKVR